MIKKSELRESYLKPEEFLKKNLIDGDLASYYYGDMPRHRRLNIPGAIHHVITRGLNRQDVFLDDCDRNDFLGRLAAVGFSFFRACANGYAKNLEADIW